MAAARLRPFLGPLLAALGLTALATARLWTAPPDTLLAWKGGEVFGHLWVWSWHGRALPAWPAGTRLAEGADPWPVVDPLVTAAGSVISRLLGLIPAYNLVVVAAVLVTFACGALSARRAGGVALVGGLALALSPVFTGSLVSGLTEDFALGPLALLVALLLVPGTDSAIAPAKGHAAAPVEGGASSPGKSSKWARFRTWITGPGRPVAAGVLLGVLTWCGLYLAWLGAMVALVTGIVESIRHPRRNGPRWVLGGLVAMALAAGPALSQGARLWSGLGHHLGSRTELFEPLWRVDPWEGADLAAFWVPGPMQLPTDFVGRLHPVYLGWVALALALAAGRSRLWIPLAATMLAAPGPLLHLFGRPLGLPDPFARLVDFLPFGFLVNHHSRLLLLGQVALALLAARGALRLGRFAWLGALALALEYALLSPVPWPLPVADASAPDVDARLGALPDGQMLWLPLGGPGVHPQRVLLDQRVHGRPLALNPNVPGPPQSIQGTELVRWLASPGGSGESPTGDQSPDPCLFVKHGITVLGVATSLSGVVRSSLGPADVTGRDGSAWNLIRLCVDGVPGRSGPPG